MSVLVFFLLFAGVSTTAALAASLAAGSLTLSIAVISLFLGIGVGLFAARQTRFSNAEIFHFNLVDHLMLLFFGLFCFRQFVWLYFFRDAGVWTLNPNNMGDLSLHLTYISNFANGAHFWPEDPIIVGHKLGYPFGIDLLTSLFVKLGVPLVNILPLMGLVGGVLTGAALFLWGRGFAVGSFLFSGGIAGFAIFHTRIFRDYQSDLAWKNLALTLLVPQRGFLFAFPAGLLLLWSWRRRFVQDKEPLPVFIEGLLWGLMPLFHFHTFIFLSFIFLLWTLSSKKISVAAKIFFWAFIPATVETLFLTDFGKGASLIWLKPGWLIGKQNPITFFWTNYGLYFPISFWAAFMAWRRRSREHLLLIAPALGFYFILLFVMLAPWEWDNTKVMVWCFLLIIPSIGELILDELEGFVRGALLICFFFSGFVAIYGSYSSSNYGFEVFHRAEVDGVCSVLRGIPSGPRFAVAQSYNHPVALCGNAVVAGYGGHLWSHGIDASKTVSRLGLIMTGSPDWRSAVHEAQARYLFWGPREEGEFRNSIKPWEKISKKIAEGPWGKIYDLQDIK